jgi:hypothetical protein
MMLLPRLRLFLKDERQLQYPTTELYLGHEMRACHPSRPPATFALDTGDAGTKGQLHPVRQSRDDQMRMM